MKPTELIKEAAERGAITVADMAKHLKKDKK